MESNQARTVHRQKVRGGHDQTGLGGEERQRRLCVFCKVAESSPGI